MGSPIERGTPAPPPAACTCQGARDEVNGSCTSAPAPSRLQPREAFFARDAGTLMAIPAVRAPGPFATAPVAWRSGSMGHAILLRSAVALAGRFPALAGADLEVAHGEVVTLLGANGAGKTSVLRACAGLLPVTSGEAVVLGCDLRADRTSVRRKVGLLGHEPALYDELSAAENVRFAVRAAGGRPDRVDPALERLGLVGRLPRTQAQRLSAGQRRRTALAALVARAPELWLLDEPHAGMDAEARELVGELVAEAADGGAAVLITSHEADLAVPMSHRVAVLAGGRVVEERPGGRSAILPGARTGPPGAETGPRLPGQPAAAGVAGIGSSAGVA